MAKTISNVLVGVAALYVKYPVGGEWVEVGYTKDGVTVEYNADTNDIRVEEETFPLARPISAEGIKVTCNMSESILARMHIAMAGSVLAGHTLTIGGGVQKEMSIKAVGTNESGHDKTLTIPLATATGTVGMSYRKAEETLVPVTFEALCSSTDISYVDSTS